MEATQLMFAEERTGEKGEGCDGEREEGREGRKRKKKRDSLKL